jgi:hypothetical protein
VRCSGDGMVVDFFLGGAFDLGGRGWKLDAGRWTLERGEEMRGQEWKGGRWGLDVCFGKVGDGKWLVSILSKE